ncbi:enhancer of mRNA-decapping protein 4 isoform X2 [Bufo bufo]|uniref:enhancer of mRNA-decapping protein 4 isoform X2 n=1 Tax=Bufo bufo TaxID=8384 RepID=UPI001ABDAF1B|nr:enhancer of mRNA-decapping protein 4 isoform X2 [Bufo bufo]
MMASASNIDVDATQHLRDILKLDRPGDPVNESTGSRKSSSFNGELNGFICDPVAHPEATSVDGPLLDSSLREVEMPFSDKQVICLSGGDSPPCIEIVGKDVEIVASSDSNICSKARGSNKVKIQPVAKYDWEQKYYNGNLIAVSNDYLAYATRGSNGTAMIRVLSITTAERILLKGITGSVTDLAFAHLNSDQLACLDEAGSLFVWKLTMKNGKIIDEIFVHIKRPDPIPLNCNRRIIWCPYIPDENEDNLSEDSSQTIALLHEDMAEIWDLDIIRANHSSWPTLISDIKEGFISVTGHSGCLSEGALSPDGTVLATASHDGYVKFWQIYIEGQDQPRCLHEWKPHNGRPVSCLLFCDNHKKQDPDVPFWRFLITGADQNRQIKMWCTVSWTCLQTIRFSPDPFSSSVLPGLKASLDLSAEFLILTDVHRKVLYVMELQQNQENGKAAFTSISEFLLTHPVLSFGIQDVSRCRFQHTEVLPSEVESDNVSEDDNLEMDEEDSAVLIKLFCVHTKALQDVQIRFKPHQGPSTETAALSSRDRHDGLATPDQIIDLGTEMCPVSESHHELLPDSLRASADFLLMPTDSKPKLMTPDAFMMPSVTVQQIVSTSTSLGSLTSVTTLNNLSSSDTSLSRSVDELTLSPKLKMDNSITGCMSGSSSGSFQASSRTPAVLIPGLSDSLTPKPVVQVSSPNLPIELQSLEPLVVPQSSPTRERSPDVISSASTVISQDIPEIASVSLQRSYPSSISVVQEENCASNHAPSMSSAASALQLLSTRSRNTSELGLRPLEFPSSMADSELVSAPGLENSKLKDQMEEVISQPWPAAPDITRETNNSLIESDRDDEVATFAASLNSFGGKGQSPRLLVKDWNTQVSPRCSPKPYKKCIKDDIDLPLSPKLAENHANFEHGELMSLLYMQQRELSELRQNQIELMQRLTDHLDAVQSSIMGHMERVIDTQQQQEQRRLDRILNDGQQRSGQLQEYLSQQLSHSLSGSLCSRLDKTVREEFKKSIPQCISKSLDPVTAQLSSTIGAKLTSIEGSLKENIGKMVKSKNITDAIGRAVADALHVPIHTTYREAFQNTVLPAFEKGCQSMFQQINSSFKQGTQEYMQQLETHLKTKKENEQEMREPLVTQLQQLLDSLQSTTDQLSSSLSGNVRSEVQQQLHVAVATMQDSILSQVQRIIKEEVNHAMKEQQAAVTSSIMHAMRSAAGTPIPSSHLDYQSQQTHIMQLLQQGHLNQAFQQALTASDLNLILYVCETVDSQQVFGQHPCPLTQPVLLSLIQQLSFDLCTRTELKLNYLEEAVMHLDHNDPVTRDHMGSIVGQVRQKLFQFLQVEPHTSLQKSARRLMIMLQGIVPSIN